MEEQMPECEVCTWKHGKELLGGTNLTTYTCWGQEKDIHYRVCNVCEMQTVFGAAKTSLENPFFSLLPSILTLSKQFESPVYTECSGTQTSCFTEQKVFKKCFWIYNTHSFLMVRIWIGPIKESRASIETGLWLIIHFSLPVFELFWFLTPLRNISVSGYAG